MPQKSWLLEGNEWNLDEMNVFHIAVLLTDVGAEYMISLSEGAPFHAFKAVFFVFYRAYTHHTRAHLLYPVFLLLNGLNHPMHSDPE